ncbi:unnamed protein product [Rhizophagus irregularis]|nr:unnamed protein product [Rhizophagus irregularis]
MIGCLLPFMLLLQPEELKDLPIQQLQHESRNYGMMLTKILLGGLSNLLSMLEDDDEVDINNSDDEKNEYTEENDYENEWEIETDKGKSKENNGSNDSSGEDGNQNQELTSDKE